MCYVETFKLRQVGALVAGLLIQGFGFEPAVGRNLFNHKWGSIAHSLSLSHTDHLDVTEKLLMDVKLQVIHPSEAGQIWCGFADCEVPLMRGHNT